jgi:hypothetical protein
MAGCSDGLTAPRAKAVEGAKLAAAPVSTSVGGNYGGITISGHATYDSVMAEKVFRQMKEMGLNWGRITIYWHEMQPKADSLADDKFAIFKRTFRIAARRGVQLSVTISESPAWARTAAGASGPAPGYGSAGRPPLREHMFAWAQFVHVLKTRYPEVPTWSIWNEPNHAMSNAEYYDLFFAAADILQNHSPRRNVAGPELAQGSSPLGLSSQAWFSEFARGLAYRTDVFTVHTYGNEEDTRTLMQYYESVIRNAGVRRPLWNTEANWGHPESNDVVHASRIMRVWDMNRQAIDAGMLWERTFGFHLYNEAEPAEEQNYVQGWAWIRYWNTPQEQPRRIYACAKWRFAGGGWPTGGCYEPAPPPAPCGTSDCAEPL